MAQNNDSPGKRLKREEAKFIKPTTQDSLNLYNNTIAVENFYKKNKVPYQFKNETSTDYGKMLLQNPFYELDKENREYNDMMKAYPALDIIKNNTKQVAIGVGQFPIYRKNIDKNKFTQRELSHGVLNIDAPMSLYDRRIKPTMLSYYKSPSVNDEVEVFKYDPIAIKPVSMLTPQERIEREKKYGKPPASIPKKKPVIERKATEIVNTLQPSQALSPILTREEIIAPVPRPVEVPPAPSMKEPVIEEKVVTERPVARKPPKAVMPRRAGGWSNQPLLMQLFPKLYER